jgi:hypothetical protein
MVAAESEEIVGLAAQELFYRKPRNKNESRYDQVLRSRESEVWGRVIDQVGIPAPQVQFTHVLDRSADNFEVFCHLVLNRSDYVIWVAQLKRAIQTVTGERENLNAYLATLPVDGKYVLSVRQQNNQPARKALLEIR